MVGREGWWEGMTIDVALHLFKICNNSRVYPVAVAAYVIAFCTRSKKQEARSKKQEKKKKKKKKKIKNIKKY